MRVLWLLLVSGCWQMTVYVGPRVTREGEVGVELGASMGAAVPTGRGAIAASIDTSHVFASTAPATTHIARGTIAEPSAKHIGTIRGVVEYTRRPQFPPSDNVRFADGFGWRAGVYAGVDSYEPAPQERSFEPIAGASAAILPWVWGFEDHTNQQSIALGFQVAAESTGALRAAVTCDLQFLPKL